VGKKEANCSENEKRQGDNWDHVAFDPESRLIVSMVPGKRTKENVEKLVHDFACRTGHRAIELMTSDEYKPYKDSILREYGHEIPQPRRHPRGRKPKPKLTPPDDLVYATVHKTRRKGRVVSAEPRLVYGTQQQLEKALENSSVSKSVNTAFIERENGTGRHRNARKMRKTYRFSKDWDIHNGMSWLECAFYNFCWPVRTLAQKVKDVVQEARDTTPAMAAGLASHVWSVREWFRFPAIVRETNNQAVL